MSTQPLQPFHLPLNATNLIEASAGTGKTYTIATLYIRLLLQIGEGALNEALTVDQILVVTFTNMATDELKGRIRERISQTKRALEAVEEAKDLYLFDDDPFLKEVIELVKDRPIAITRLAIAEQDFDLAAIFTIHGFCSQMLKRYAFNSAVPFEMKMLEETEKNQLYRRFAQEVWREMFYGQSLAVARFVKDIAKMESPDAFLKTLKNFVGGNALTVPDEKLSVENFIDELNNQAEKQQQLISPFKTFWTSQTEVLQALFEKEQKNISHFSNRIKPAFEKVNGWIESNSSELPEGLAKYFTQEFFSTKKGATAVENPVYVETLAFVEAFKALQAQQTKLKALLLYFFNQRLTEKLDQFKATHEEKSSDDLLHLMEGALKGEQGKELALRIGTQYPFAMIDEFQDTDPQQYFIFQQIYLSQLPTVKGFLMIGDPKQSIYKFRGADIFSYLNASKTTDHRFTLDHNWRSHPSIIDGVNALFDFDNKPFLYDSIPFQKVFAAKSAMDFTRYGKLEPAWRIYWQEDESKEAMAKSCALSIRQYLEEGKNKQAFLKDDALQAANIAVLLRSREEATLVQEALSELGIPSVYLSDSTNLFSTPTAKDMLWILKACLNPLKEKNLLNALTCGTFSLTAQEIDGLKQNERAWEATVQRFLTYQQMWLTKGVLPMLHLLMQQENLTDKRFLQASGERYLTDFLHLAEILQQGSLKNETPMALVRWFERFVLEPSDSPTAELRLESDRALVKLVTIHKSKGLAYDIVWLPFIGVSGVKKGSKASIQTYYDEKNQQVQWDWQQQQEEAIYQESCAEEMRLLYVALTRAKYQILMNLPPLYKKNWSAFYYALSHGALGLKTPSSKDHIPWAGVITTWQEKIGASQLVAESANVLPEVSTPFLQSDETEKLTVSDFTQAIDRSWQLASFSQWLYRHEKALPRDSEKNIPFLEKFQQDTDYDEVKTTMSINEVVSTDYPRPFSCTLPAGRHIGTALHSFFETLDFQAPIDREDPSFLRLTKTLQIAEEDTADRDQLVIWLEGILTTPLVPYSDLALCQLTERDRLNEMEFFFKVDEDFKLSQLNKSLVEHGIQPINLQDFHGLMHGFMDLVCRFEGKYYVLDYKSNLLGETLQDYEKFQLQQAMRDHHYDWQYLIYCVALHRYLAKRLANYDYDSHFGGVIYPFLRGMTGEPCQGVFFTRPDRAFIEQLEEIF